MEIRDLRLSKSFSFRDFSNIKEKLGFTFGDITLLALCFLIGFLIRLIPELMVFSKPLGFDTVYYATRLSDGVIWTQWSDFFTTSWLLYSFFAPFHILQTNPFLVLKFLAPLLYGLNVAAIYWFGRKKLGWGKKMCLIAAVLFSIQLAALRISWDLLRNLLGMSLLLFSLSYIDRLSSKTDFILFLFFSLLTVFAHEYSAVILLGIIIISIIWHLIDKEFRWPDQKIILAAIPAFIVFLIGFLLRFHTFPSTTTNIIGTDEFVFGRSFFFVNYLSVNDGVFYYPKYLDLLFDVTILFCFLYFSYFLLIFKGFFKDRILIIWTSILLICTFGCLVFPFFAVDLWSRWMFLLVYPFTFYATNGIHRIFNSKHLRLNKIQIGYIIASLIIALSLTSMYLATPVLMKKTNIGVYSFPQVSAHFSSAPGVPFEDVNDVISSMSWLNDNIEMDSSVLLQDAFLYWGRLYLNNSVLKVRFLNNIKAALDLTLKEDLSKAYLIWWKQDIGWYNLTIPDQFIELKSFNRITIYLYNE